MAYYKCGMNIIFKSLTVLKRQLTRNKLRRNYQNVVKNNYGKKKKLFKKYLSNV